jgi:hypothetical protein
MMTREELEAVMAKKVDPAPAKESEQNSKSDE